MDKQILEKLEMISFKVSIVQVIVCSMFGMEFAKLFIK